MTKSAPDLLAHWPQDGCLSIENAITGGELTHLQTAFDESAAATKADWLQGVRNGTAPAAFFDIPEALQLNPLFVNLVDHPAYYPLLQELTGGETVFLFPQFRTVPPSPLSYVGWHFDVPRTTPLHLKVQIYLQDIGPGDGAFAYVPGSHIEGAGPYPSVRQLEDMPGQRTFYGKAGTALIFNSYGMHTSLRNTSASPRRSIILIYEKFCEKKYNPGRLLPYADQINTAERRRLFGIER
jgi:hypothetical protein